MSEHAARLVVYSHAWCHLCDEMIAALREVQGTENFALEVVEIGEQPELELRFGERVPVLVTHDGEELCHYWLDRAKVNEYLGKFR